MRRGRDSWEKVTPEMENKWLEEDVEESVKEEEEEEERGRVCSRLGREDGCKICWWSNRFLRCEHCTKELQKELKEIDRKREAEKELQKEIETEIERMSKETEERWKESERWWNWRPLERPAQELAKTREQLDKEDEELMNQLSPFRPKRGVGKDEEVMGNTKLRRCGQFLKEELDEAMKEPKDLKNDEDNCYSLQISLITPSLRLIASSTVIVIIVLRSTIIMRLLVRIR